METKQTYQYDVFSTETYRLTMDRPMSEEEETDLKECFAFPDRAAWELRDINTGVKEVS